MNKFNLIIEKIFKFFSSIQLAIFILLSLGIMSATGTILEARYDTNFAQKMVYQSPYMYFIMALLCVNLINVMIDRWPWQPHHAGFIFAHVGIIIVIVGSLITKLYGLDGSMIFDIGQKSRYVTVPEQEVAVYASFGEGQYKIVYSITRDFLVNPPSEKKPFEFNIDGEKFKVSDYYNYSLRQSKLIDSPHAQSGPAIRVQLQNDRVNVTEWVIRTGTAPVSEMNLGPAKIIFADASYVYVYEGGNVIIIRAANDKDLTYEIHTASQGNKVTRGQLPLAEAVSTGWMGLQLRVLKYIPHAEEKIEYVKLEHPTGLTTPAIHVQYKGQNHWLGLNSNIRFFTDSLVYVVTYRNRSIDLGFELGLENFTVGRYQGTSQAMSYESIVAVPNKGSVKIAMNEPLKHEGYTFYQASFQEDQMGRATTSVLSVNKDPGRILKYFGCFILISGIIIMFYFKRYRIKIFGQKRD